MARKTNLTDSERPQEAAVLPSTDEIAGAVETVAPDLAEIPQDTPPPQSTEDSLDAREGEDKAEVQPATDGVTVTISGPKKGRRRAGRAFGPEPVSLTLSELGEDAMQAILSDPALTVMVSNE